MGQKTFKQIVDEGMLNAGADHLSVEVSAGLNNWLLRQSQAWPWPHLSTDIVFNLYPVLQDSETKDYYVIPEYLFNFTKILNPRLLLIDSLGVKYNLNIRDRTAARGFVDYDYSFGNPTTRNHRPKFVRFVMFNGNQWGKIILDSNPSLEFKVQMSVQNKPDGYEYGAIESLVPWYPNDDTMVKIAEAETLKYLNGPDDKSHLQVMDVARTLASADRVALGNDLSQNSQLRLSTRFR